MPVCERVWETGDPCVHPAEQQLCGVWMCHDHLAMIREEAGAIVRLYIARGGRLWSDEERRRRHQGLL